MFIAIQPLGDFGVEHIEFLSNSLAHQVCVDGGAAGVLKRKGIEFEKRSFGKPLVILRQERFEAF